MLQKSEITFGTDPELFLVDSKGVVRGSEKVIPAAKSAATGYGKVIRDGVQVEFNADPQSCRELLGQQLRYCFTHLDRLVQLEREKGGDFNISLAQVVTVTPRELTSLSPESQQFGCAPSYNIYDVSAAVGVDGKTYMKRAAGGHLHLGSLPHTIYYSKAYHGAYSYVSEVDHRRRLVAILDLLVGNTCVMLDRDPGQVERRKHYGRAGEFRLPKHGLEYRTLSNFWLRNYVLMSFVTNLARMGVSILADTLASPWGEVKVDLEKALLEKVDFAAVQKAIDTNDAKLALKNFRHVEDFIFKHVREQGQNWPLNRGTVKAFKKFASEVQEKGLEAMFPEDPIKHWKTLTPIGTSVGWEAYIKRYKRAQSQP